MSGGVTASYVYDGDGNRVKETIGGATRVFVGNTYEVDNGTVKKYYYAGAARVAESSGGVLYYLLSDHLGSTALTLDSSGARQTELRYYPFGAARYNANNQVTTYRFTGQRWDSGTALYFYQSRWYDPLIGRFLAADTIVPRPQNPQNLNRYSYVGNRPLRFSDPSGHAKCEDADCTRVLHPVTGKLVRRQPAHINWASVPAVVQFIYQELLTNAKGSTVSQLANLNSQCMGCGVPAIAGAPSVARMSDQVNRLKAMAIFAWKVRQGGEWDPKPKLVAEFRGSKISPYWAALGEVEYYYDVWGNIEYGYLGTASAFSGDALLEGAGAEQIGSSLGYTVKERSLEYLPRRTSGVQGWRAFDDPADQIGIQIGIDLWNTYNLTLTPMDIIDAIERTPGLAIR